MVAYNLNNPDGPNNPSNDQPKMQTNTNAIQALLAVDHVAFNTNGSPPNGVGGHHLQVSFDGKNAAGAQTDPQSVLYTGSGTASTFSQLLYRNQSAIFQISAIRAWGFVNGTTGTVIASQSSNATSVRNSAGNYTITLATGAVSTANFAVLVSATRTIASNRRVLSSYNITGIGVFQLSFAQTAADPGEDVTSFSFQVLQI